MTYQNATTFWFLSGNNIKLYGGGTIDGNGQVWWDQYAITKVRFDWSMRMIM
jgi:galacturan 1,4-alpha-galacturonidase